MNLLKKKLSIKNWAFVAQNDGYTAPERRTLRVSGSSNHPKYGKEFLILSSGVLEINHQSRLVETHNTIYYLLGPANPKWEEEMKKQNRYEEFKNLIEEQRALIV